MLISLLIPWTIRADYVSPPTGFFMLLGSLEFIDMLGPDELARHPDWAFETLILMSPLWAIPVLALSSLFLWRRNNETILMAHRILLGLIALVTVSRFWIVGTLRASVGYWANTAIILGSVLVEMFLWYDNHRKT